MRDALGLIETIGYPPAMAAVDAACKCADVEFLGFERVIGAGQRVSLLVKLRGEVAAVTAAVEAGIEAAGLVGKVFASRVIARPHESVSGLVFSNESMPKQRKGGPQS